MPTVDEAVAAVTVEQDTLLAAINAPPTPEDLEPWRKQLDAQKDGNYRPNIANCTVMLEHHTHTAGIFGFDQFAQRAVLLKQPPWDDSASPWRERPLSDLDILHTTRWLQQQAIPDASVRTTGDAIELVAQRHSFHAVRRYLESLPPWDGTPRLESWLSVLYGAADTPYTRAIARWFLIGAVARIYQPGCRHDHMLVLVGPQGVGKSSGMAMLFGQQWFADRLSDMHTKDAAMELHDKWCCEISELSAVRRSDLETVKAFMSRTHDHYRPPYGRKIIEVPRQCVLVGTTNDDGFLIDPTGNRRLWPAAVKQLAEPALLRERRDQLWSEALVAYQAGAAWWPEPGDAIFTDALADQHEEFREADPWESVWDDYTRDKLSVAIPEFLQHSHLALAPSEHSKAFMMRVGSIARSKGWERYRVKVSGEREYRYRRKAVKRNLETVAGDE